MLFQKKYLNQKIETEIKEKGFCVYNYVNLKELFLTVQRDYLAILSKINSYFGVVTVILGLIGFITESFFFFFYFLFGVYAIIFLFLLFKLIFRTYYFLKITDVVYTEKGIIFGNKLYSRSKENKLLKKLDEYEEMFDEFLSKPSKIEKIISRKKTELLEKNLEMGKGSLELALKIDLNFRLGIALFLLHLSYVGALYFFYYFGYFFGIIIFFIINIFIKIILRFTKNTEVKIKGIIEDIDASFKNMKNIDKILSHNISNFKDGNISNISEDIEKNFSNFYFEVISILEQKKKLFNLINNSQFKDFVNFEKLEKYLKNNFNKPVLEMTSMLEKFEKLLEKQIELLRITKSNSEIADLNLDKKEVLLKHKLDILISNRKKLEGSVM